jgi:ABC-type nitrate/sulfonate/bicarbonate transport system substrate-binding protein
MRRSNRDVVIALALVADVLVFGASSVARVQRSFPEVRVLVVLPVMSFSAVWVAEQLGFFAEEGVNAKVALAGGGSPWRRK